MADKIKELENKISELEERINNISSITKITNLSKEAFTVFYNRIKYQIPKETGLQPLVIWLDNKFSTSLQNKVLYPDETGTFWYMTGVIDAIPICFREQESDYQVDFRTIGDFGI